MTNPDKVMHGGGVIHPRKGLWPKLADDVFIASGSHVIGDVEIGAGSSVWFNCVLRGDVNSIRMGERSNIQDGTIVHVSRRTYPTTIGDDVLIGHMAMIHGCTLGNSSFVGLGAIVMDGCEIETGGMLAAGGLLTPGKRIGRNQLWAGRPARYLRDLTEEEMKFNAGGSSHYVELGQSYLTEYRQSLEGESV